MPIVVNDIMRVAASGLIGSQGQAHVNVYYAKIAIVVDATDTAVLLDLKTWLDSVLAPLLPFMSDKLTVTRYRMENVTQQTTLSDVTATLAGTDLVNAMLPTQVAGYVIGQTSVKGVRASKFWGGFTEASNELEGKISSATIVALEAAASTWVTPFVSATGNGWTPQVARNTAVPPAPPLWTSDDMIDGQPTPFWRTQRRRTSKIAGA